jgi:NAD(P)-dependent dehydrogenase (short-subunit alcohol dehydrogenase family)
MLTGKTVFVSGGTGCIGAAICRAFYKYGATIIFSYHKSEAAATELSAELPGARAVKIDLRSVQDITSQIQALYKEIEVIDVLVNNAGVAQIMPFSMLAEEDLDLLLDINVKGTVFLTKAVVRRMIKHKQGVIINMGSIAGHRILDVPVHYALSKAAIAGFTVSLAAELKRFGIRVNSVVPGMIEDGVSRGIPEELRQEYLDHCAVGRPGSAEEVAETVCFLASSKAAYINGQNLFVDGGV